MEKQEIYDLMYDLHDFCGCGCCGDFGKVKIEMREATDIIWEYIESLKGDGKGEQ